MEKIMAFNKIKIDENGTLIHYFLDEDEYSIKIPKEVKKIRGNFLCNHSDCVKEVFIPSSVTEIAPSAFYCCENLETIEFEDVKSITKIGICAFMGCKNLTNIQLPNISIIDKMLFYGCSKLQKIVIPESVKIIEDSAFEKCLSFTKIDIPSSIEKISYCSFYYCKNLTEVLIKNSKKQLTIEPFAFIGCEKLSVVKLSNKIQRIYHDAFAKCPSIKEIYIDDNYSDYAFKNFDKNWDNETGEFKVVFNDNQKLTKEEAKIVRNENE